MEGQEVPSLHEVRKLQVENTRFRAVLENIAKTPTETEEIVPPSGHGGNVVEYCSRCQVHVPGHLPGCPVGAAQEALNGVERLWRVHALTVCPECRVAYVGVPQEPGELLPCGHTPKVLLTASELPDLVSSAELLEKAKESYAWLLIEDDLGIDEIPGA